LLNLTVNARDAMPDGGTITIEATPASQGPGGKLKAGGYVRLRVIDSGSGMDEATLARATEPFFTTKGVGKGTGLGLSMVEGLASQSGGQFVLSSASGAGTTAELWLPATEDVPAGEVQPQAPASASARRLVVLVVDDDGLVLASTMAMIEELGHTVLGASSAAEAPADPAQRASRATAAHRSGHASDDRGTTHRRGSSGAPCSAGRPGHRLRRARQRTASIDRQVDKPFGQQALAQAIAASTRAE
jgi:hypothetical protein